MTTEPATSAPLRFTLPSGKVVNFGAGLDPNKKETALYIQSFIAKNFPDDAKALGITVKPAGNDFDQFFNELQVGGGGLVSAAEGLVDFITQDKNQDQWGGQAFANAKRADYKPVAQLEAARGDLNLGTIARSVVESAPSTAASMAIGGLAGLAAKAIGAGAGLAAPVAAKVGIAAGIGTATASEAGIGAGDAFNNTFQGIVNQKNDPNSPIRNSAAFRDALRAANGNEDEAWSQIALNQASTAAPLAGIANAVPALIGGKILAKTLQPIVERAGGAASRAISKTGVGTGAKEFLENTKVRPVVGTLKTAAKTSGVEGVEEFLQSGGEMAAQNFAMSQVDPRVNVMDGVGDAAVRGGLAGMLGGAAFGGGLGAVSAYQQEADRSVVQGGQNQADFRNEMAAKANEGQLETAKAATNAAYDARQATATKIAQQRAAEAALPANPQIAGTRYEPSALPQDPAVVPRIGVDRTVVKPETFDAPKPFFEEFGRARGEVRSLIEPTETSGPRRVVIKRSVGKGKKAVEQEVAAHEEFDRIFTPDKKLEEAATNHSAAKRQYDRDMSAYKKKPDAEKKNYKRHIADSRAQLAKAAEGLRNARKAAEPIMRKQANQWNDVARRNKLPEVRIGERASSVALSEARRPGGPLVPAQRPQQQQTPSQPPRQAAPTQQQPVDNQDQLFQEYETLEQENTRITSELNNKPPAPVAAKLNARKEQNLQRIAQIDKSLSEIGSAQIEPVGPQNASPNSRSSFIREAQAGIDSLKSQPPQGINPAQPPQGIESQPAAGSKSPAIEEAYRLIDQAQLPVERTDITTPEPQQQEREQKLTDDAQYEIVPVTSEGKMAEFRDRMAVEDGSYVGPALQYAVLETRRGLHGTNIGKVLKSRFATREAAEDRLSESKRPKEQLKLSDTAWQRKQARDEEAAESKREKEAQDEAAVNYAAKAAYDKVYSDMSSKAIGLMNEEVKRVGLQDKGLTVTVTDKVADYIKTYNNMNSIRGPQARASMELGKFDNSNLGALVTTGTKENPLNIIAVNKNLINPNMTPEQMREVIQRVVRHELVHALVRGGLITPSEYSMLLRIIRKRVMPQVPGKPSGKITYLEYTQAAYKDANPSVQEEEAIAELITLEGFGSSRTPIGSEGRGILDKIVRIIKSMIGLFQNKDSRAFFDLMDEVSSGKVGERLLGKIGIDPTNILDPLGRNLQIGRADMSSPSLMYDSSDDFIIALPLVGNPDEVFNLSRLLIKYRNENNGMTPGGLDVSGIWGTPVRNVGVKIKPEYAIGGGYGKLRDAFKEYKMTKQEKRSVGQNGKTTVHEEINITSPDGTFLTLGDMLDLSKIASQNPVVAQKLAETRVLVSKLEPGQTAGLISKARRPTDSRVLIDGVEQNLVIISPESAIMSGTPKGSIAHEFQHLVNSVTSMTGMVSARGAGAGFSLRNKTPNFSGGQIDAGITEADAPGSPLREMTIGGLDFLSAKISQEAGAALQKLREHGPEVGLSDGPIMVAYQKLMDASSGMANQLWQGMFDSADAIGRNIASLNEAVNDPEMIIVLQHMNALFMTNSMRANDKMTKVLDRMIDENPSAANTYSFIAANIKYRKALEAILQIEKSIYSRYAGKTAGFPSALKSQQVLLSTLEAMSRRLGTSAYFVEEGEAQARAASNSIDNVGERVLPISQRQEFVSQLVNPTVLPDQYSKEQIENAFPEMKIDEQTLANIRLSSERSPFFLGENSGETALYEYRDMEERDSSLTSDELMQQSKKGMGGRANMKSGDVSAISGLNVGDVNTLLDIFKEEPAINIEEATKRLNQKKTSERRPYRPNEVQAIVNRLASINKDLTRNGANLEALKKYERLWGTDKLKGVISDASAGVPFSTMAKTHGIANSTLRAAISDMNIQISEVEAGGISPELSARRLPPVVIQKADDLYAKGMGIKPLRKEDQGMVDSGFAIDAAYAISGNKNFAPSRGSSYVMQEMLRESEDGGRGRTLGQILKSLREAGYRGGNTPVIKAFMEAEKRLRAKYDPEYYIGGGRVDMKSGDDETGESGNVIRVDFRKGRTPIDEKQEAAQEIRDVFGETAKNLRELRKEVYDIDSGDPTEIGAMMLATLRKERPILWKRLTDAAKKRAEDRGYENEIEKNLGEQFTNSTLSDGERSLKEINRKISNYKRFSTQEGEISAGRERTFADLAEFMEWGRDKYLIPYYTAAGGRVDMASNNSDFKRAGVNKFDWRFPPMKVTPEMEKKARRELSDFEYDVFDIVRNGPPQGVTSEQIAEEINQYRDADRLIEPLDIRNVMVAIKKKGLPFPDAVADKAARTKKVMELHAAGVKNNDIARRLYAEDMARMDGMTEQERLKRASNTVASIISQEKKKTSGGSRVDMSATASSKVIGAILKANDHRKQAIVRNAQSYAQNHTGDAVLDQITALHRLFGKHMGNPENFIFDQINMAEGLERIVERYRQAGGKLDSESNPVFAEDANRGKTRPEIERVVEETVSPALEYINSLDITDAMIEELSKVSETAANWYAAQKENGRDDNNYRSAGLYLLAKHAPEREAFIKAKKRQGAELKDGERAKGVGIQLDEAAKIVEFFERKAGQEKMANLSRLVRNISDKITEIRKTGGLIPKDIESIFQFYVPARGFAERDGEEDANFVTISPGSRGRTALRQDPATRGRLSLPDDPLTSMAQMLQVAIMRKNANETLNSLRRLVENNAGLFEGKGTFVATVHYEKPPGLNLNESPLWLRGRIINSTEGQDASTAEDANIFYIELSDEFVNVSRYFMPSMHKRGDVEKLLASTRMVEPAMSFLRAMRTSKNPTFLPVNLVRDIGAGVFNIEMYLPGAQLQFLSRTPAVLANLTKDFFSKGEGKPTTKYGILAKEFIDNGGNQNLYVIDDYDRVASNIAKKLQKINSGEQNVVDKAKESVISLGDYFEKANNAAELVSRVAAYSIARERFLAQGMSQKEAISRAVYIGRNLTVNFNKHGNIGKGMNNLYMFWNASIGGTSQILRAFESSPKVRAQLMTIVGLGVAMPFIMRALLGDEYEKIPAWVRDRNFIVPVGGGNYFTVPMPYGYSWFMTMGQNASESMYKAQDPSYGLGGAAQWMALRSVDGLMNNFAPTGASEDLLTLVAPTLADPVLELAMNKDWTGRPIMPEPGFRDTDRESQRFWSNTSPIYTAISDMVSGLTGGHNRIDGLIEISPNALEYISEFVFGGLGKFVNQNVALVSGKAQDVSDIPIVRSFIGTTTGEVSVAADYSTLQNKVKRVEKSIEDAKAAGNIRMLGDLERQYAFEAGLINSFRRAERLIEKQQSIRRAIENKYRESDSERNENDRQRLEEVKDRIKQIKSSAIDEVLAQRRG